MSEQEKFEMTSMDAKFKILVLGALNWMLGYIAAEMESAEKNLEGRRYYEDWNARQRELVRELEQETK